MANGLRTVFETKIKQCKLSGIAGVGNRASDVSLDALAYARNMSLAERRAMSLGESWKLHYSTQNTKYSLLTVDFYDDGQLKRFSSSLSTVRSLLLDKGHRRTPR